MCAGFSRSADAGERCHAQPKAATKPAAKRAPPKPKPGPLNTILAGIKNTLGGGHAPSSSSESDEPAGARLLAVPRRGALRTKVLHRLRATPTRRGVSDARAGE